MGNHLIPKTLAEEKHPNHDSDGHYPEYGHGPLDQIQNFAELPDVCGKLIDELTWEEVGPEAFFPFAE